MKGREGRASNNNQVNAREPSAAAAVDISAVRDVPESSGHISGGRSAVLAISIIVILIAGKTSDASAQNSGAGYLDAARGAAAWLESIAVSDPSTKGLSWPRSDMSSIRMTGMDEGSAGIGEFFLQLYRATLDTQYLNVAEGASDYVYDQYRRGNFFGPDWLAGAAGGGTFFVDMFRATREERFLDRAKFVAQWLIDNATHDGDGYYWRHYAGFPKLYTGMAHGAAGVGAFFLGLFVESGDSTYLHYADGALRWSSRYTVQLSDSTIGWKRLTTDTVPYHLWCGGSTGMVFFLDSLYRATGESRYRDLLRQTAVGLRDEAVSTDGGVAWHYTTSDVSFPLIYCHGTASTALALYLAGSELGDATLTSTAARGAAWLRNVERKSGPSDHSWPHILGWNQYDTGLYTGTASVGRSFLGYHGFDPDSGFMNEAEAAASYLLSVADHPAAGQLRWINYTSPDDPDYDVKAYYSGLYSGTAGVGTFFLELYRAIDSGGEQGSTSLPSGYAELSNYPNPFNAGTKILVKLPADGTVDLELFDVLGRKVGTLLRQAFMKSGTHIISWNGRDGSGRALTSGVYFAVLRHGRGTVTGKLLILK